MNKQYRPNIVRGGVALPLGNNYYFMKGRKHKQGGIDVGKDLEVEDGEIMKVSPKEVKVFSSVPFLNGQSPVEKLLGGENPNKVFAQQERFKKVNKINDDGTKAQLGKGKKITNTEIPESQQYAVTTPDGQRKVFNSKQEASDYVTVNTPKGYSLYDITNYGSNIDKGQTAILNRNTEREIEKATEQEELTKARLATRKQNQEIGKEMLSYMPIIGDGMDLYSIAKDVYNKNYGNAGIGLGLLALPNVIEKPLKYVGKGIKKLYTNVTDRLNINSWFDSGIKSSKDINDKNLQNITDEEWDKLYNKAIKNNNLKEAQNLRDLHFKAKTVNNKVDKDQYHVVGDNYDPNFTIFNPKENHTSIYTTDNIDMASSYSKYWLSNEEKLKSLNNLREKDISYKNKIIKDLQEELDYRQNNNKSNNYKYENTESLKARLDIKLKDLELLNDDNNFQNYYNFYNTTPQPNRVKKLNIYLKNPIQIDNGGNNWNNIRISNLPKDVYDNIKVDRRSNFLDSRYSTLSLENVSKDLGYDGVIIDNITDYGKHWGDKYINFNTPNQVLIINDKTKLKLADAITYDDDGNIIPLSKRDDFTNPDIRYNWLLPTIGVGTGLSLINNNENNQYKYGGKKMNNKNNINYIYNKVNKYDKNFTKRLRDKNRKHITNWEDTTQISTHKLGVGTDNEGRHYIYPEVQEVNGQLVDYTRPPFNKIAGMINAEETGDTIRVNSVKDGVKFTQEYKNRYMNKKQLGGKANIYRVDSNGKSGLRMNISTGDKSKNRQKAFLGTTKRDVKGNIWYFPTEEDIKKLDTTYTGGDHIYKNGYSYINDNIMPMTDDVIFTKDLPYSGYDGTNDFIDVNRTVQAKNAISSNNKPFNAGYDIYNKDREGYYNFNRYKTNTNTNKKFVNTVTTNKNNGVIVNNTNKNINKNTNKVNVNTNKNVNNEYKPKLLPSYFTLNGERLGKSTDNGVNIKPGVSDEFFVKSVDKNKLIKPTIKNNNIFKTSNDNKPKFLNATTSDYIGFGANALGNIASALINANTINKMKYNSAPIPKMSAKLKTNFNINPQLDHNREILHQGISDIDTNTSSSNVGLNRKNQLRLANIMNTNKLYSTKENVETELINKDRLNQQNVANSNIDDYNKWSEKEAAFNNAKLDKLSENRVSLVQGLSQGVNNFINNIEKREQFNNNLVAIMAANPNVNPRILKELGFKGITDEQIANWERVNKR